MDQGNQEFLNQVVNLLSLRVGRPVLVLVHCEKGLEVLSNTNDLIHKRGMLEVGIDILREIRMVSEEMMRETEKEAQATVAMITKPEGKAN